MNGNTDRVRRLSGIFFTLIHLPFSIDVRFCYFISIILKPIDYIACYIENDNLFSF